MNPYYQDDLVTLYHGDCREVTEWLAADVLVTDPPYGVSMSTLRHRRNESAIKGEAWTGQSSTRVITTEQTIVRDDALTLWAGKPALVFGHWRAPRPTGTKMRLIWDKRALGGGAVAPWRPADEEIYVCGAWPNPKNPKGANQPSVIHFPPLRGRARPAHPTPKPVDLLAYLIGYCPPGVIADPFAGSGSTLLAARQLGRPVIGVEFEERYCELIANRLSEPIADGLFEVAS